MVNLQSNGRLICSLLCISQYSNSYAVGPVCFKYCSFPDHAVESQNVRVALQNSPKFRPTGFQGYNVIHMEESFAYLHIRFLHTL